MHESGDITELLAQAQRGDGAAEGALLQTIYALLRQRAHHMLHGEANPSALRSGTLVHETFAKLFRSGSKVAFQDRVHFYHVAARAMRQVIIDHARKRTASRRGGGRVNLPIDEIDLPQVQGSLSIEELLAVAASCDRLAAAKPFWARVVELHFWGGLSVSEIADIMDISKTTVDNRLKMGKAFLHRDLAGGEPKSATAGR